MNRPELMPAILRNSYTKNDGLQADIQQIQTSIPPQMCLEDLNIHVFIRFWARKFIQFHQISINEERRAIIECPDFTFILINTKD